MNRFINVAFLLTSLASCKLQTENQQIDAWKQEILEAESNFAKMVKEQGMHKGFMTYAAENAVLMRSNELFIGKQEINELYQGQDATGLSWEPDFVEVAASGDLGYTYGRYIFTYTDSTGTENRNAGVFHTVWKRQADGAWRFVWD
jgi:ketosteroid isomerase-like protein